MDVRFQFLRHSSEIGKTLRDDGWQVETEGNNYLSVHHPEATNEFTARILRLVTAGNPDVHTFEIGHPDATLTVQHAGQASGLGDVVLRTKYEKLNLDIEYGAPPALVAMRNAKQVFEHARGRRSR